MELKVLGSSSSGNSYILDNGKEALVIECGICISKVKKAVNFDINRIVGALVSHEHGDHAKYVQSFAREWIDVYCSPGTAKELRQKYNTKSKVLIPGEATEMGGFKVISFKTEHDSADPVGFLINHEETGTILFATDTYYLKYTFEGLNNILIECNYKLNILEENIRIGKVHPILRNRVIQSHMSFETCMETLQANDLQAVHNIVLIHLSSSNSNPEEFKKGIEKATGHKVTVAKKGLKLNFNKTPF